MDGSTTRADAHPRQDVIDRLCEQGSITQLRAALALSIAAVEILARHPAGSAAMSVKEHGATLWLSFTEAPVHLVELSPPTAAVVTAPAKSIAFPVSATAADDLVTGPFSDAEKAFIVEQLDLGADAKAIAFELKRKTAAVALQIHRMTPKPRPEAAAPEPSSEISERDQVAAGDEPPSAAAAPESRDLESAPAPVHQPPVETPAAPQAPVPASASERFLSALAEVRDEATLSPLAGHLARRPMQDWTAAMDLQLMEMSFNGDGMDLVCLELGRSKKEIRARFDLLTKDRAFKMADVVAELQRAARSAA